MGISVSDAIRMLLVRVAAEKAPPFDVKVPNATPVKNLAARPNLSNDDLQAKHLKKNSKTADRRRSLIVPPLQRFRVLWVERIGH